MRSLSAFSSAVGLMSLWPTIVAAQYDTAWVRHFEGIDLPFNAEVRIDSMHNVYLADLENSRNHVIKYDSSGVFQWSHQVIGPSGFPDTSHAFTLSRAGAACGIAQLSGNSAAYLYEPDGNSRWVAVWDTTRSGSSAPWDLAVGSNEEVYITGRFTSLPEFVQSSFLACFNSSGTLLWDTLYLPSGSSTARGYALEMDQFGNVYMFGFSGAGRAFVVKYDPLGTLVWDFITDFPFSFNVESNRVFRVDSTGNVFGFTGSTMFKLGSTGSLAWSVPEGGNLKDLACDQVGGVYSISYEMNLMRRSPLGDVQWTRELPGDFPYVKIAIDTTGLVYVAGSGKVYVLSSSGDSIWAGAVEGDASALGIDLDGNIYVVGSSFLAAKVERKNSGASAPSFVTTKLVPLACACNCHADPSNCDGFQNITDVVQTVNVAFRAAAPIVDPNAACPYQTTDLNCSGTTDVIDVVKMVNVAFRGANPATEFCNPCP